MTWLICKQLRYKELIIYSECLNINIYILDVLSENVVYIPIITSSHVSSVMSK